MAGTTKKTSTAKKADGTKKTTTRTRTTAKAKEVKPVPIMGEDVVEEATVEVKAEAVPEIKEEVVTEAKVVVEEKPDKRDIEIENLKAQIEQMKQLMAQQSAQPQQIVVTTDNSERVWFLWLADVSDDNQILIGENGQYGRIVGKTGTFYVPKNDISRVMDSAIRYYLQNRWLIITSGLTEEEREALGVNYKEGELLDEKAFRRMTEMGKELLDIFPSLCDAHKEMVASRYHEDYMMNKKIDRNMVVELNRLYPSVAFKDILEDMNFKEANAHNG